MTFVVFLGALLAQDDGVPKLIERFGADTEEARVKATDEVVKLGRAALPHLEKALGHPHPDVRLRAKEAMRRIHRAAFRGGLLSGRAARGTSAVQAGGGEDTEAAVLAGLRWLARHQSPDGSWKPSGHVARCKETACAHG